MSFYKTIDILKIRDYNKKSIQSKEMELLENRNCKKCNKVFQYSTGYPLCNECKAKDEEEFKLVREYIRDHPGIKIEDVAKALNISPQQILRYLREERLEVFSQSEKFILCEFCGCMIKTGRFCDVCKDKINRELRIESGNTIGDTYFYSDDEENKITNLKKKGLR